MEVPLVTKETKASPIPDPDYMQYLEETLEVYERIGMTLEDICSSSSSSSSVEQPTLEQLTAQVRTNSILDRKDLSSLQKTKLSPRKSFRNSQRVVSDEIQSRVGGVEIVIVMGDIRAAFDFVIPKGARPDLSQYIYNQQRF
nr:uncharacterized protein LOC109167327 [Ipomoea batatas]